MRCIKGVEIIFSPATAVASSISAQLLLDFIETSQKLFNSDTFFLFCVPTKPKEIYVDPEARKQYLQRASMCGPRFLTEPNMKCIEEELQDARNNCRSEIHHVQNIFSTNYPRFRGWATLICLKIRDEISSTGQVGDQTKECAMRLLELSKEIQKQPQDAARFLSSPKAALFGTKRQSVKLVETITARKL